ncbi:MAG: DUF2206 domain-containing protein [Halobacteriota archaeon]
MFTGFSMNMFYPLFGISRPISITPLIITISVVVLLLCVLCYARDKNFSDPSFIDIDDILSPPALFLCLIPFLAIFGTYLVNFYYNNILLMLMIVVISLVVLLIAFDKFIPKNLYPLAVFTIAISLLYHVSLISMYVSGYDIQFEYFLCNLVKMNGIWDPTIPYTYNAMLSLTMLAPVYSIILNMDITWVFKIIYPLLFSLVPLGLYRIFQKQTNDKIAFLSVFFFLSIFTFYTEMIQLARQQIAELLLVLLILVMIDKNMNKIKRSFLFIVFGISLGVSHYGLSYLYMFSLISAWLILVLIDNPAMQKLKCDFHSKFIRYKNKKLAGNPISSKVENRTISSTFVLLFITFTLTWYMYVSSSSAFYAIAHIGDQIANSIFTDFLNPEAAQGLDFILRKTTTPLHSILKYLHLLSQFFIAIGIITLVLKRKEMKFEDEYVAFSVIGFAICFITIAVPYFAAMNTARLYHIVLFFLAPFCVIGGMTVFRIWSTIVRARASWTDQHVRSSLKILSVFFMIFLLFNTGFIFEIAKDKPTSISLNNTMDYSRFNEQESLTGEWLEDKKDTDGKIYADVYRSSLLWGIFGERHMFHGDEEITTWMPNNNLYIFLGRGNIKNGKIGLMAPDKRVKTVDLQNLTFYNTLLKMNKIYSNGDAQVYYR